MLNKYKTKLRFLLMGVVLLAMPSLSYGKEDASDSSELSVDIERGVSTRNIWRGLDYGSAPSVWGDLYGSFKSFSIGAMGTTTLNGSKAQYGTWLELYASYEFKGISLIIDDYFFFNSEDKDNNFFDYSRDQTQHLVEARLEYDNDYIKALVGYVIYSNRADKTNGVYLEATYKLNKKLSFTTGYLTGAQSLSFYDDGGVTTLGINGHKSVKFAGQKLNLKASLIFNPNYANASPTVGNNPVYFVLSSDF